MWRQVRTGAEGPLGAVNAATRNVLTYCVTEMLNNAIDHSAGAEARVTLSFEADDVVVGISDDGVGVFPHVQEHFGLPSLPAAAAHLAKGHQTTAPAAHSGPGLFFTSKSVDHFEISSAGLAWRVDNTRSDQALIDVAGQPGTQVVIRTKSGGARILKDVFDRFADVEDNAFNRSEMRVSLVSMGSEFVSRSEAKRIAAGLESTRGSSSTSRASMAWARASSTSCSASGRGPTPTPCWSPPTATTRSGS